MKSVAEIISRMEQEDLEQRDQGVGRDQRWRSIPRESGHFLYHQVISMKPHVIVEIGTSHGFSTAWMGLAAKSYGGVVHTYEVEQWRFEQAASNFNDLGLSKTIIQYLVKDDSPEYPSSIDFAFIDAEKEEYLDHIKAIEPFLNPGATVFADNTISHQDDLQGYVDYVRNHPDFVSYCNPIGKGIETTMRLKDHNDIKTVW